jgi:flagellin
MPQIINTNIASLNAQRNLDKSQSAQETALQRLSSGLRINSAKDDAAGLAIANRLDTQVRGLSVASRNAGDGVSLAQIAEGSIESIDTNLQRLRELAVQSANGTNGASERESLNAEAQQLIEEIERTATNASFNGVKLLDGSFQNKLFQVGANVGDEVSISLSAVGADTLGAAVTAGLSSNMTRTATAANAAAGADLALASGDLVINGVSIRASASADDTASNALAGSSAIAKAAAINDSSSQTGVTAVVAENTVAGTVKANALAATDADFAINGVTFNIQIAVETTATGTKTGLEKVAGEINSKADLTGVTATVVEVDTGFRIDLTAADGRNIDILDTDAGDAAAAGIAAGAATNANVYMGNVTLVSADGSDITLTSTTDDIDNSGFEEGVFNGAVGGIVGDNGNDGTRAALTAGDLVINGTNIGITLDSDDVASSTLNSSSGISLAAAINRASDTTGVTATVNENTVYSGAVTAGAVSGFTINGEAITVATGTTVAEQLTNVISGINAKSGQTGVRAEALDSDQYRLIAEDGRNIAVGGTVTNTGFAAAENYIAGVSLQSGGQFEITSKTANIARSGLNVGTFGGAETGTLLKDIDISTESGAKAAIAAADNALSQISSVRAELGSIQSRFENVIAANAATIEAFSASSSRIKDADFAAETAALSRAQVLQQAGISVLAQANARPQQVLSLLQ